MLGLEMVVVLGAALLLSGLLERRFPVAPALLLVLAGVLVGLMPALLSWESLTTSLRWIGSNLRVVVLASTGLVVATAGAVAVITHVQGLPWGRCGCSAAPSHRSTPPPWACSPGRCHGAT